MDLSFADPSISESAAFDILPWNLPSAPYLHGRSPEAPSVSVVYQDVSPWPPTFVAFGGGEMFHDPMRRFVDSLFAAGVDTESHEEPGMFHVFPILMAWATPSRRVLASLGEFVDKRFHRSPPGHELDRNESVICPATWGFPISLRPQMLGVRRREHRKSAQMSMLKRREYLTSAALDNES